MIEQKITKNLSLSPLTTFKIGGLAKYFLKVSDQRELIKAIKWSKNKKISYFILGGGSNILISDQGFDGLVIKLDFNTIKVLPSQSRNRVRVLVGAGASLPKLVDFSLTHDLTGLEWLSGIPGTVGGAVRGNAGVREHSISKSIQSVKVLKKGIVKKLKTKEIKFAYRQSIFKQNKDIILEVILILQKGISQETRKIILKNIRYRILTQPSECSTGCIFKNVEFTKILQDVLIKNPKIKQFKLTGKVPAGWLIEQCGLKEKKIGGAKISEKHANFIVNIDSAQAKDVLDLIKIIKSKVKAKFKLDLEEEIGHVGF